MKKCIICGKNKKNNEFNIEHIIPEALGNKSLKFDKVCIECNSNLGIKVDRYITTGFFMELVRYNYKVVGKNNKMPFPFKDGMDEDGNNVRLNSNFKPSIVTTVNEQDDKFIIKTSSKNEAIKIIEKKYKRGKLNINQKNKIISIIENTDNKKTNPSISYSFEINFNEIELAILKIAYEYTYLRLGDTYYYDECGIKIRNIILQAINNNKIEKCNLIYRLPNKFNKNINYLAKQFNNSHLLKMQTINNRIILLISLFTEMSMSYMINISNNADRYDNVNFAEFIILDKWR